MVTGIGGDEARVSEAQAGLWSLLRHPQDGWARLDPEPMSAGALVGLAAALAAIGPVAVLIHDLAFGRSSMGIIQYRPTLAGGIVSALAAWLFSLAAAMLLALGIDLLAGALGGTRNRVAALKVAVYGATPFWLAQVFALLPQTNWLQLIGFYSLLLIFAGAPLLGHVREESALTMGGGAAALALVLAIASLVAAGAVARSWIEPTVKTSEGREVVRSAPVLTETRLTAPASDKRNAVAPGTAAAAASNVAVPASSLQSLLPAAIGGFARTAVESQSSILAGVATADAKGTYVAGTSSFTLTITDAGQPGALASSNTVAAGEYEKVTDSGFQRSRVVNGVRVTEKWSNADHGGVYGRTVAGRFIVEAQGTAGSIDVLRGAVAAVDQRRLGAMGR